MKSRLALFGLAYRLAWKASPGGVVGQAMVNAASLAFSGPLLAIGLERVVGSLSAGAGPPSGWIALVTVSVAAAVGIDYLWETCRREVFEKARHSANTALLSALTTPVSIRHLEDPEYADALTAAQRQPQAAGLLVDWLNSLLVSVPGICLTLALLGRIDVRLVLIALSALIIGPLHGRARKSALRFIDRTVPGQRLGQELFRVATDRASAQEVRLFGLGAWLQTRHRREFDQVARAIARAEQRPQVLMLLAGLGQAGLLSWGLLLLMNSAIRGEVSAGQVAAAIVLLAGGLDHMFNLSSAASDVVRNTHTMEKLAMVLNLGEMGRAREAAPVPAALSAEIEFAGVSFSYPWTERRVLAEVDLAIPAGRVVAVVGENGAGKTTLVQLLLRLYDPDEGQIRVDGVDITQFEPVKWREATTVGFQNFARYNFLAREAIGIGDPPHVDDMREVRRAASEAGSEGFLSALSEEFETQLGPHYGGADLSEGQWQRVALARTSMRQHPLLTVLDEPTSALDPIAEEEVFRQYAARTEANRAIGGITLLISHRFSTVALADLIVVLHEGRVIDVGPHAELMARGGLYAELYSLQASRYR